jgi:4-amino-4-deoxy-L-arabinose transferase-like glycosyltransferase
MVESSTPEPAAPSAEPAAPVVSAPAEPAAVASAAAPAATATGDPSDGRPRARHRFALALILLFHAALGAWMAIPRGPYDPYFYDEKFNMDNVAQLVATHGLEPANGWYPLLSYLPQALLVLGLHELNQLYGPPWPAAFDPAAEPPLNVSYGAFMAARWVGILYGTLTLFLVYRLGWRLYSPAAGVLAALALACSPWQIRTSVEFKPDSLLLLTSLAAVLLMLRFLEQPTLGRYLWVGAGLGLAASSKWNGAFIGPLAAMACIAGAVLAEPRGFRHAVKRLAIWGAAGAAVAAAVFFGTSPYFKLMLGYMSRIERFYGQRDNIDSRMDVVRQFVTDLPTPFFLGPVTWWLALFGLVLALVLLLERGAPWPRRLGRLLPLAFLLSYGALLVFTLKYYKHNHLVQFLPFLALAAGCGLARLGGLAGRRPGWLGRGLATIALLAFTAHGAWQALSFSYDENVPHDWQVLARQLHNNAPLDSPRVTIYEGSYETLPTYRFTRRADAAILLSSVHWIEDAGAEPRERLDLADVVVLRKDLGGPQRGALLASLAGAVAPGAVVEIDPHPLKVRGHGFVSIYHLWREREDGAAELACRNSEDKAIFNCRLPADFLPGEVAALHFSFWSKRQVGVAEIVVGGEEGESLKPLASADLGDGKGWEAMSERFVVPGPGAPVWLRFEMPIEGPLSGAVPVTISRWLPPENVKLDIPWPFKGGRKPPRPPAEGLPAVEPAATPVTESPPPPADPADPADQSQDPPPAASPAAEAPPVDPPAEPPPAEPPPGGGGH